MHTPALLPIEYKQTFARKDGKQWYKMEAKNLNNLCMELNNINNKNKNIFT